MTFLIRIRRCLLLLPFSLMTTTVHGLTFFNSASSQKNIASCPVDYLAVDLPVSKNLTSADIAQLPIEITADQAYSNEQSAVLIGNVKFYRGDEIINANQIELDRNTNILSNSEGHTRYRSPQFSLKAEQVENYIDQELVKAKNADYYLAPTNAQGHAANVEVNNATRKSRYQEVTYSSCIRNDESWQIAAKTLEVDEVAGMAKAEDVTFRVKGVPVMYLPYFAFPINDERHSGFLVPYVDYTKEGGFAFKAPYYLNLASNMDATLVPGYYAKRGLFLGAEFRYLNKWQSLTLAAEMLPNDRVYEEKEREIQQNNPDAKLSGNDRWSVYAHQSWTSIPNAFIDLEFKQVSDPDYVEDFDNSLSLLTESNLERYANFDYYGGNWQSSLRFQHTQVLDRDIFLEDPYSRMPQWTFTGDWSSNGFDYGIDVEAVRFTTNIRSEDPTLRPKYGNRLDIMPYIGYRLDKGWGYIYPKLAYRYTAYDLAYDHMNQPLTRQYDENITRGLPIFSIDSGLFFERDTQFDKLFGGGRFTQTLEPRLYYLYAPYRDQSNIPLFDTELITPSYFSLFLPNRFTGADRQMDANQLTTALTTRFINTDTGEEHLRLSMGQIQYFSDRNVGLNDTNTQTLGQSAWIVEGEARITKSLSILGGLQWGPSYYKYQSDGVTLCNPSQPTKCKTSNDVSRLSLDLRYKPSERRIFNIAYRYAEEDEGVSERTKQIDFAGFYEINANWAVVGRYNYSFEANKTAEVLAGVEYNGCCESIRLVARYRNDITDVGSDNGNLGIYLQIELTGLTRVGRDVDELWRNSVTGYNGSSDWRAR